MKQRVGAYYNEHDAKAAAWIRELITQKHIADGEVDERSIVNVAAEDLRGFAQCHFFAGIGVWSYALRRAGWDDARPVWTGSCPCQPFSASGRQEGFSDERHLWPDFFRLISECRPDVVFGEQVASPLGLAWIDAVHADLEGAGYAVGAVDTCAAGVGAPHIRQRLYWVADSGERGCAGLASPRLHGRWEGALGDEPTTRDADGPCRDDHARRGDARDLGDAAGRGCGEFWNPTLAGCCGYAHSADAIDRPCPTNGLWGAADWLFCTDGKWRPVEPGTFPLAHGAPARVGRLRGYGNAINAEQATAFIEAYLDLGASA